MRRDEGIHESLKVGSPPLRKSLANLPFAFVAVVGELIARRSESLIQANLEALDLISVGWKVISRKFEEGVCDLQHQDVGMVVVVAYEDTFAGSPHAVCIVMFFQALQASED